METILDKTASTIKEVKSILDLNFESKNQFIISFLNYKQDFENIIEEIYKDNELKHYDKFWLLDDLKHKRELLINSFSLINFFDCVYVKDKIIEYIVKVDFEEIYKEVEVIYHSKQYEKSFQYYHKKLFETEFKILGIIENFQTILDKHLILKEKIFFKTAYVKEGKLEIANLYFRVQELLLLSSIGNLETLLNNIIRNIRVSYFEYFMPSLNEIRYSFDSFQNKVNVSFPHILKPQLSKNELTTNTGFNLGLSEPQLIELYNFLVKENCLYPNQEKHFIKAFNGTELEDFEKLKYYKKAKLSVFVDRICNKYQRELINNGIWVKTSIVFKNISNRGISNTLFQAYHTKPNKEFLSNLNNFLSTQKSV